MTETSGSGEVQNSNSETLNQTNVEEKKFTQKDFTDHATKEERKWKEKLSGITTQHQEELTEKDKIIERYQKYFKEQVSFQLDGLSPLEKKAVEKLMEKDIFEAMDLLNESAKETDKSKKTFPLTPKPDEQQGQERKIKRFL